MGAVTSCPVSVLAPNEQDSPFAIRWPVGQPNGPVQNPPDFQSMQDVTLDYFKKNGNKPYLGTRTNADGSIGPDYHFLSYSQTEKYCHAFSAGLAKRGIVQKSMFGVYSANCPEWLITIDGSALYGYVIVSLYDSLCKDALAYLIKHSKITSILVSATNCDRLFSTIAKEERGLVESVILIHDAHPESRAAVEAMGIEVTTFQAICKEGEQCLLPKLPKIDPEDPHFICYSSGTTGNPKGVIISHRATTSNNLAVKKLIPCENCRYLSYLPLSHVFERAAVTLVAMAGGKISFITEGNVKHLLADLVVVKPTIFAAVPRVMNRFYDGVQAKLQKSALKKMIFWGAWYAKRWCLPRSVPTFLFDSIVFNQIKQLMGGCVEQFIVGGAAMDAKIHEFLQVATGIPLRSGYGLTEAGSGNICNPLDIRCIKPGTVGGPLSNVMVKLEPISDYDDPQCGELLVGGQCLSSGYLFDQEATNSLFVDSSKKWIHTGDVAKWDSDGYLMIVDRMRSIFKLSQGEYVAAEAVTQVYLQSDLVSQIFVFGDSTRTCLVGIIVPKIGSVAKFFGKENLTDEEFAALCKKPELKAEVMKQLNKCAVDNKLFGYQFIRGVYLDPIEWTIENQLMTPTFKLKRKALQDKYAVQIQEIYDSIEVPAK